MLIAVWCAMRCIEQSLREQRRWFSWMCVACGAALGMVLSSWPIFVLIPLTAWWMARGALENDAGARGAGMLFIRRSVSGVAVAACVYLLTNPYIVINALTNREVLRSNFGNSLAMYDISRVLSGLVRVIALTIEGATLPVLLLGVVALVVAFVRRDRAAAPLVVAAIVFFLQFVLIGAEKPAEYGRFGIFTNAALVIAAACLLTSKRFSGNMILRRALPIVVCLWVGIGGAAYLRNFLIDTTDDNSRTSAARRIGRWIDDADRNPSRNFVAVVSDPAPYGCPPLPFASQRVMILPRGYGEGASLRSYLLVQPVDRLSEMSDARMGGPRPNSKWWPTWLSETPISWANKPFVVTPPPPALTVR